MIFRVGKSMAKMGNVASDGCHSVAVGKITNSSTLTTGNRRNNAGIGPKKMQESSQGLCSAH